MPKRDSKHEGRDKVEMDIDRMINEGLAGGVVHHHYHAKQIEEARDLKHEEPPHKIEE